MNKLPKCRANSDCQTEEAKSQAGQCVPKCRAGWVIHQHEKRWYPWMFHHLQIWGTCLSGGGWRKHFSPQFLNCSLCSPPLYPLIQKSLHVGVNVEGTERGVTMWRQEYIWGLTGVAVKKFWCKKEKKEKNPPLIGRSKLIARLGFPHDAQNWTTQWKRQSTFFHLFPPFVSCAKLQLSRNLR